MCFRPGQPLWSCNKFRGHKYNWGFRSEFRDLAKHNFVWKLYHTVNIKLTAFKGGWSLLWHIPENIEVPLLWISWLDLEKYQYLNTKFERTASPCRPGLLSLDSKITAPRLTSAAQHGFILTTVCIFGFSRCCTTYVMLYYLGFNSHISRRYTISI